MDQRAVSLRVLASVLVCVVAGAGVAQATSSYAHPYLSADYVRVGDEYHTVVLELRGGAFVLASMSATALPVGTVEDGFYDYDVARLKLSAVAVGGGVYAQAELSAGAGFRLHSRTDVTVDNAAGVPLVSLPGGTFVMGELEEDYFGPPFTFDAPQHTVTVSPFEMSAAQITNAQYVNFLNAAEADGLVEVAVGSDPGPDFGDTVIFGTSNAPADYAGQVIMAHEGTRVMKDHDNADGDGNEFTGNIEPENPLNTCFVGYNPDAELGSRFFVEDPRSDFDWVAMTDYCDYHPTLPNIQDPASCHNDFADWPELQSTDSLPSLAEVSEWPATFVRWTGARAFALYYDLDLPTEAQLEYAARGGADFVYGTADGNVNGDGSSANWNYDGASPPTHHVYDTRSLDINPFGLYNLVGNAWEWAHDYYGATFYDDTDGAVDPVNEDSASGKRVRRFGAWNYHLQTLKSAARFSDEEFKGNDHFGFRVVRNA